MAAQDSTLPAVVTRLSDPGASAPRAPHGSGGDVVRRRRRARWSEAGASDDESALYGSSGDASPTHADSGIMRTASLDRGGSAEASSIAASPATAAVLATSGIERKGSPTLRMLGQMERPFERDSEGAHGLQVRTARGAPRTRSEQGTGVASAPATTRDTTAASTPLGAPGLGPDPTTMTPISEATGASPHQPLATPAPAAASLSSGAPPRPDPRGLVAAAWPSAAAAQSLLQYVTAELQPGPIYPTTDVVWGQTERDRVYNALMAVPYQLERVMWYGMALCLDSFLAIFTLLPLRVAVAAYAALQSTLSMMRRGRQGLAKPAHPRLRGDQLFDLLCAAMFAGLVSFLWTLRAGAIYFWVKELTQEFLKLSVLHTALELADKICCSFGVDVLEALAASCTTLATAPQWTPRAALNVASDATVTFALLVTHGLALMAQALVFGVAMNSQKHTLLALLIAANFTEIKGTVFKRFDPTKLWVATCQDIVERFHLLIVLAFVLAEEAGGAGVSAPSARLLRQCCYVVLAEMVIDVIKHAVLGKFNEIRPGVYREFMRDLCEKVTASQSHSVHRLVGFEPFAPAALFLRVAITYESLQRESAAAAAGGGEGWTLASLVRGLLYLLAAVLLWVGLVAIKTALGFLLKRAAVAYLRQYDAERSRGRAAAGLRTRVPPVAPALMQVHSVAAQSGTPTKKDS